MNARAAPEDLSALKLPAKPELCTGELAHLSVGPLKAAVNIRGHQARRRKSGDSGTDQRCGSLA
ncbi:hypothetical protein KCP70_11160 [Salmonella enterica subsp. enterica]|nr:hypothetical protein KCP70_11160 [Salmonella enterica subsp. enterica]